MVTAPKTISLLCPTRGRPEKALRLALSVLQTAHRPERIELLLYVDTDDVTKSDYIQTFEAHQAKLSQLKNCSFIVNEPIGVSKAWNELAAACQGDLLIMAADDQTYNDRGWDDRLDLETQKFPDDIFCMWFNDGHWGEKLCTFPIVSRKWCLTLGYFTTGIFECLYDDLWIMDLAKRVGRLHYIPDVLTEHLHWGYGKAEIDATYELKQVNAQGKLKPAVRRDMDLFGRTAPYREVDAHRLAAVMAGPVTLQPGLSKIGRSSIFEAIAKPQTAQAQPQPQQPEQPAPPATSTQLVTLAIARGEASTNLQLQLDAKAFTQSLMLNQFSQGQFYEPDLSHFLIKALKPGDSFVDIGAHIGYFSLLAAALVGHQGAVYTFEMEPSNYQKIISHIQLNQFSNLQVFNIALGSETKTTQFHFNLDNDGGHALWNVGTHPFNQNSRLKQAQKEIYMTTLDAVLSQRSVSRIKAIKIDTEGAEFQVLQGSLNTLKTHQVPYIICEINRFGLQQMGTTEQALRGWMATLGYDTYLMRSQAPNLIKLTPDQYCQTSAVFNVLFSNTQPPL